MLPRCPQPRLVLLTAFSTLVALHSISIAQPAPGKGAPDWIRGSGQALEMRLTAMIADQDGTPVDKGTAQLRITYNSKTYEQIDAPIENGRFSAWLPVNKYEWYAIFIDVMTPDGRRCTRVVERQELRELVVNGLSLELAQPSKTVRIRTLHDGENVAGATVRVTLTSGAILRANSDESGEAKLELLQDEKLSKLTAWTKTGLLGGYQFSRKPTRDPLASEHTVEMVECKTAPVHVNDQSGTPIAGVSLEVQAATPPPNFNYFGMPDDSVVITNDAGIATFDWFPNIDSPHAYATILDDGWFKVTSGPKDDHIELVSTRRETQTIVGQVSGGTSFTGGFGVDLYSFDGGAGDHSERRHVFTNPDGSFSAEVVPDATYCYFIDDVRWTSQMIDGILFDSGAGKSISPVLFLAEGIPVRFELSAGPSHKPLRDIFVGLQTEHSFSWEEENRKRHGSISRNIRCRSDRNGIVEGFAPAGKLQVRYYTKDWQKKEEYDVRRDEENVFRFHRASAGRTKFACQLTTAEGDVAFAKIHAGSVDGETRDSFELKADLDGRFELETVASELAVVAISQDGQLAATAIINNVHQPATITLTPTMSYKGKVLDADGEPVAGHKAWATISAGVEDFTKPYITSFSIPPIPGETDAGGVFRFSGLPSETEIRITVDDQERGRPRTIDTVYLVPGESRPVKVTRTVEPPKPSAVAQSLEERYQSNLRDCRLFKYNLMVIIRDPSNKAADSLVKSEITNRAKNPATMGYIHLVLDSKQVAQSPLGASKDWPQIPSGSVFVCIYDQQGNELARQQLDAAAEQVSQSAAKLVESHTPPQIDALETWEKAFADAKKTNRKVWIVAGGRYCGPCFRLGRWTDDHRDILEKYFVIAKVDSFAHKNGSEVSQRFIQGRQVGIPFHAMYDAGENMLADSFGPLGNIGGIAGFEGTRHFKNMLTAASTNISAEEIDALLLSLNSND